MIPPDITLSRFAPPDTTPRPAPRSVQLSVLIYMYRLALKEMPSEERLGTESEFKPNLVNSVCYLVEATVQVGGCLCLALLSCVISARVWCAGLFSGALGVLGFGVLRLGAARLRCRPTPTHTYTLQL